MISYFSEDKVRQVLRILFVIEHTMLPLSAIFRGKLTEFAQ